MRVLLAFFILILLNSSLIAQKNKSSDYFEEFKKFRKSNPELAFVKAELAYETAKIESDSLMIAEALGAMGYLRKNEGNYKEAIDLYLYALGIAERNNYSIKRYLLNFLGNCYLQYGEYEKALSNQYEYLQICESENNHEGIGIANNQIGNIYYKLGHIDYALTHYQKSYEIHQKLGNKLRHSSALSIGLAYLEKENYDEALKIFDKLIRECVECDQDIIMQAHNGFGVSFFYQEMYSLSEDHFNKSEQIARVKENQVISLVNNHYKGLIALKQEKFDDAEIYLNISLATASENVLSPHWQKENYRVISLLEEKRGNYQLSLMYNQMYQDLKDSIVNERIVQNVNKTHLEYLTKKNEKEMASMGVQLERTSMINKLMIGLMVSAFIILALLISMMRARKKSSIRLKTAYQEVENQKSLLSVKVEEQTLDLRKSNEELSNFIYKTSHDIRGPLTRLQGLCDIAMLEIDDERSLDYFNKLRDASIGLVGTVSRIQHITHIKNIERQIQPVFIDSLVNDVIEKLPKALKDGVDIDIPVSDYTLLSDYHLLKTTLENVVDNAFRYARVNNRRVPNVKFGITKYIDRVELSIRDNGVGINIENKSKLFELFFKGDNIYNKNEAPGIGLYLAKIACDKLNGSIKLESEPGKFTEVVISIPLDVEDNKSRISIGRKSSMFPKMT